MSDKPIPSTIHNDLPEIGTLRYTGSEARGPQNPLNLNGLGFGNRRQGLSSRLLQGIQFLVERKPSSSERPTEGMGVIRYNLPTPLYQYRMDRQRRRARMQAMLVPVAALVALAIGVPIAMQGKPPASAAKAPVAKPAPVQAAAPEPQTYRVAAGDTLGAIARRFKVSTKTLMLANGLTEKSVIGIGQELRIPLALAPSNPNGVAPAQPEDQQPAVMAPAVEPKPEVRKNPTTYVVRSGDTPSEIAERMGLKTATLLYANDLTERSTLRVGQELTVPPADGFYYTLRDGESLSHLAVRYGVSAQEIQNANGISDVRRLRKGQKLFIPGVLPKPEKRAEAEERTRFRKRDEFQTASRGLLGDLGRAVASKYLWPTVGRVSSYFGERGSRMHTGVDIPNRYGAPIRASRPGVVVAAGWNGDYGKTVDISHGNGVVTRYAHCSTILVTPGDKVDAGDTIAKVGATGRATGPHLHYEVRVHGRPVNPQKFHKH